MRFIPAIMDVDQVSQPSDGRPRFLRIPTPIVSPSFFCPECAHQHAERHKRKSDIGKVVCDVYFFFRDFAFLEKQEIERHLEKPH